ncbi:MAG: hypothetical protein CVT67_08135 [Actinobacteria bacterium HGW-Actinobacteria-7]|jgi:GNAT superfamily N-acetyltransferase|nr:MAG: hypothetical protein CVT67_08135 [Actinobacteria bacterium HGW-Actinobacteria-7]
MKIRRSTAQAPFADFELAKRLESFSAAEMRRFAQTAGAVFSGSPAGWIEVAGGIAAFIEVDSPVNQATGMGFAGVVDALEIEEVERFYLDRGAGPLVRVCPLAHPSLLVGLSARGWIADGFENVLVRTVAQGDAMVDHLVEGVEIREVATDEERDLWRLVAATGFSWPLPPLDAQLDLGTVVVRRPGTRLFLAFIEGRAAGTGELFIQDGIAWLSADATLPQFRGRGVQRALQAYRLALSAAGGCELAVSEATPGAGSQRNMERAGFRVAYTRLDMILPVPGRA